MKVNEEALAQYQQLIAEQRQGIFATDAAWLNAQRDLAVERFALSGFPTRKQEAWRYTNIDSLLAKTFEYPSLPDYSESLRDTEILTEGETHRIVFVNGRFSATHSRLDTIPQGVYIAGLKQAINDRSALVKAILEKEPSDNRHVFNDLNTALFSDGMVLHVDKDVEVDLPIEVLYLTTAEKQTYVVSPRNMVLLESGAKATLIERYWGTDSSAYFTNGLGEVLLKPDSQLQHYRLQEESVSAHHISTVFVRQEQHSRYNGNTIALGGNWSRTDYHINFRGEYAHNELNGLYLVKDKQLADIHLNIHHAVPHCSSNQDFRGILLGKGRGVFDGLINVAKDAQKTEAHLSNANLVLSRSAEVDTKPQLLIYADDVKCSHGTTVGQLESEQLFYLRSRGIAEEDAKKMLCLGFAHEVLDKCPIDAIREKAQLALRGSLEKVSEAGNG